MRQLANLDGSAGRNPDFNCADPVFVTRCRRPLCPLALSKGLADLRRDGVVWIEELAVRGCLPGKKKSLQNSELDIVWDWI
jgi:hypothetical protein